MSKKPTSRRPSGSMGTSLRAYRFNHELVRRFDADCDRHLRNPRLVLEALIYHWLSLPPQERERVANEYQRHNRTITK